MQFSATLVHACCISCQIRLPTSFSNLKLFVLGQSFNQTPHAHTCLARQLFPLSQANTRRNFLLGMDPRTRTKHALSARFRPVECVASRWLGVSPPVAFPNFYWLLIRLLPSSHTVEKNRVAPSKPLALVVVAHNCTMWNCGAKYNGAGFQCKSPSMYTSSSCISLLLSFQ